MRCGHCSHDVPDGAFCTRCGAHQGTTAESGDAKTREHRYAAHPGEHVAQPSVITTLFPHLGHHKIHEFRWAFIAGLAGILVLYLAGLITAAILVSAFLVPVLYLIYLYEAQVYRDEPATVLGFTPWHRQNDFKRQFALILGQKNQLWWDLPAAESLELNRVIYGIDPASARRTN